jgi:hypothetical protein
MKLRKIILSLLVMGFAINQAEAGEADALNISRIMQKYHSPFGMVFTTVYTSPTNRDIEKWVDLGDSALWTGTYLAAESFRYKVTKSPEALQNARKTLAAVRKIVLLPGDGSLARYFYPVNGPKVQESLATNMGPNLLQGKLDGQDYYYFTRTSRDQYAGVYFGLAVAYDFLDDIEARKTAKELITVLTDYLLANLWTTYNPDGTARTTFIKKPDQQLSILQVARHVNPAKFKAAYEKMRASSAGNVWLPVFIENQDVDNSYFKYNLTYLYLYNLIRLEESGSPYMKEYVKAYDMLRDTLKDHGNAHFNMIDRALKGSNKQRDDETKKLLTLFLKRGLRNKAVDVRGKYEACKENRACNPIPVDERPPTDFLWQRGPFDMYGGGDGRIESPGIDYILPYWMSRYYSKPAISRLFNGWNPYKPKNP